METRKSNRRKLLLWIGDEISKAAPTCLPGGEELFNHQVEMSCGKNALQVIRRTHQVYNELLFQVNKSMGCIIYPEQMLRQWGKIQAVHLNQGVEGFLKMPYNLYHCYIAMLLAEGMDVITVNYDLCIEHAYEVYTGGTDRMTLREHENGVYIYAGEREKAGKVYHIHGSAENPGDIGPVLSVDDLYFSNTFRRKMHEWMENDYMVYFLGYSGKDLFDVNMYLDIYHKRAEIRWKGAFVSQIPRKEQPKQVKNLLKLFYDNQIICQPDIIFLQELAKKVKRSTHREVKEEAYALMKNNSYEPVCWKDAFHNELVKARSYKDIIMLHINQALGISVEAMDPAIMKRLNKMSLENQNMYESLMLRYQYDLIPAYGYSISPIHKAAGKDDIIERELIHLCNDGYNQDNREIGKIALIVEKIQREYEFSLRRHTDGTKLENEAEELIEDIEDLLLLELPMVNHKNKAILYRVRGVARAIYAFGEAEELKAIEKDLCNAYMYSSQSANMQGICKTMESGSFCYLSFYYKSGKKSYYDKSQRLKTLRRKFRQGNI